VSVAPDGAGGWRLVVPGAVAAVVGPDTLSTSSFDSLIDLVAIDAAATITSIPFSATFVTAPPAHGQAGGHGARPARPVIRVSATGLGASLPADASVGAHGLRFELWLTVMPQRRAARVMFPERIALRARPPASRPALRPRVGLGGRLQLGGRPERLPARAWRVARRLTRRLSRRAAAVVRRLGRRVRRIAGG